MEIMLLASSFIALAIFLVISLFLIKEIRTSSFNSKEIPLIILGLTYITFATVLFLWATNSFIFNSTDFLIVFSIILTIQTACLLTILYKITKDKKIFYALFPFSSLILLISFAPMSIHFAIPTSLFITLLAFLSIISLHKNTTRYIILYTSVSLLLYIFAILWKNITPILILISVILFLTFTIPFLKFLQKIPSRRSYTTRKAKSPVLHFLKHLIFIVIITNFIFIGTVTIHELGHITVAKFSDCENTKIVYEAGFLPRTEVNCSGNSQKQGWILGGIILPFLIAILLMFVGGKFIKEIALEMIGFNLMIAYLDVQALGFSPAIATFTMVSGISISALSLALLAKSRTED
ncbi:hypothetical protein K8R30_02785 [archaeon]|nr:hypothetical protein [archaeon]